MERGYDHLLFMAPLFSSKQWVLSHLFLGLLLFLSTLTLPHALRQKTLVSFLDVGQGDAILVRTPEHKNILIDAGIGGSSVGILSQTLPFFNQKIDLFVLTHPDRDHFAGFLDILEKHPVAHVMLTGVVSEDPLYTHMLSVLKKRGIPLLIPENTADLQIGETLFLDFLYPFEGHSLVAQKVSDKNNTSLSLSLRTEEGNQVLLTGDAEAPQERELLLSGQNLSSPILKAGHHGSRSSSIPAFLEAVSPDTVVISAGQDNPFGHPHPEVMERIKTLNVRQTLKEGTVTFAF